MALGFAVLLAFAQATPAQVDFDQVESWMRENLDDSVLHLLDQIDREQARALFNELMTSFANNDVYELAPLKDAASNLVPVLDRFEATRPYASWLKTHLDYLEVADELKRKAPAAPPTNPSPEVQRTVWDTRLEKRPVPARAQKYLPRLKPIFTQQGVPAALVWIAEVESSFDPAARSPAGAVGMFQLMPATARSLGLAVSPSDERLDPEKSAQAAAKYLRYLHGRFKDWRLALAAYNCGESRVHHLLTRHQTRSYSAIATRLPAETQMYIPKIEATLHKREAVSLTGLRLPAPRPVSNSD